jgi:hypothetical protein
MQQDLYTVERSRSGRGYDVVRNEPSVIATELKAEEAISLAIALTKQVSHIENPPK